MKIILSLQLENTWVALSHSLSSLKKSSKTEWKVLSEEGDPVPFNKLTFLRGLFAYLNKYVNYKMYVLLNCFPIGRKYNPKL